MSNFMLAKIVSGGQTGVDQAALAAAIAMGVEHGDGVLRVAGQSEGEFPLCSS